jgi:hypothetical protein
VPAKSAALEHFDPDLLLEYERVLAEARDEINVVDGASGVHDVLLERFAFIYVLLRNMERSYGADEFDLQRYNQLTTLFLSIGKDLLTSYKSLFNRTAVERVFVESVFKIVSDEVADPEVLARVRARVSGLREE